jgi:hypothetical protein
MKKQIYLLAIVVAILSFHHQSFAQQTETPATSKTGIHKTDAFGLDLGIGSLMFKEQILINNYYFGSENSFELRHNYPVFAVGVRYTHLFNPYIGADAVKINFNSPFRIKHDKGFMNLQIMTGIRGITPVFFKTMSGYAAVRMGYGFRFPINENNDDNFFHGIAFETEIGLNITRTFFIGFSYNLMNLFLDGNINLINLDGLPLFRYSYSTNINFNTYALRIGFNF